MQIWIYLMLIAGLGGCAHAVQFETLFIRLCSTMKTFQSSALLNIFQNGELKSSELWRSQPGTWFARKELLTFNEQRGAFPSETDQPFQVPKRKGNGSGCNQTSAAVIANHPFTNAFVRASSQSHLREAMSDQPNRRPDIFNLAAPVPQPKT